MATTAPNDLESGLASANRHSKNVCVFAVIIVELELGNIQWMVLFADLMEASDDTAFDDRPKTFNRICVDCDDNVLAFSVVNDGVCG
jgi:hypothetical protein